MEGGDQEGVVLKDYGGREDVAEWWRRRSRIWVSRVGGGGGGVEGGLGRKYIWGTLSI